MPAPPPFRPGRAVSPPPRTGNYRDAREAAAFQQLGVVPCSTIFLCCMTTILSAETIVERRCAMMNVVRFFINCASDSLIRFSVSSRGRRPRRESGSADPRGRRGQAPAAVPPARGSPPLPSWVQPRLAQDEVGRSRASPPRRPLHPSRRAFRVVFSSIVPENRGLRNEADGRAARRGSDRGCRYRRCGSGRPAVRRRRDQVHEGFSGSRGADQWPPPRPDRR